jgi:translation initiation factor 2 subunit 1
LSKWDEESELPEIGELVVATVKEIKRFGAYLYLDDYDIDAYLPISEVSSRWVRNISDVIKVDQKIVVKVLRVDYRNRTVDVSLKEVSKREGERVLRKWKRDQRGIQIISEMVDALELDESVVEEKISPLIEREPSVYDALEKIVIEPKLLDELTFKNEKREILEFLSKRIKPRVYLYEVRFQAYSIEKNGIGILKSTLEDIEKRILDEAKDIKL